MKKAIVFVTLISSLLSAGNASLAATGNNFLPDDKCEYHYWDGQQIKCCPDATGRWHCSDR